METSETIRPDKNAANNPGSSRQQPGRVISVQQRDGDNLIFCEKAAILVQFTTQDIVRVKVFTGRNLDLCNLNPRNLDRSTTEAVVPQEDIEQVELTEDLDTYTLTTGSFSVIVNKNPFSLRTIQEDGTPGFEMMDLRFGGKGQAVCMAQADAASHFYGLGEKTSFLDKRGEHYEMWNSDVYAPHVPEIEALYVSIPYLVHHQPGRTYGVFLDNPGRSSFDMRARTNAYAFSATTGNLDFYVIHGKSLKEVTKNYTGLTGRMALPPKWALGYHQSRYSYMNQDEVISLAETFREKEIPCDAIYLDIHYMDGYRVFTFDNTRFPDPKGMMEQLEQLGFHVVPIVDPGVKQDPLYPIYREGVEHGHFCKYLEGDLFIGEVWPGKAAFPDFTEDETAYWWGEKHEFYVKNGIRGIWNDMNEPAVFNGIKTMEPGVMHGNNGDAKTHGELHNLYGLLMSKATYEGMKRQLDGERPFVLTRAGYAGVQRYAAVWTGDNRSFWEHLAMAIPMVLNLGMSGVAFTGPDIGGFAHHTSGELLARWTQMGALFPFSRNHSALDTLRQEPWSFGPEVEKICRDYIQLRYRWLPYLYSLFFEASQSGVPVMRPLVLEYPDDANTSNLSDEFLLGDGVLVAPVYRPNTEHRAVYLPDGVWYDYWTGERYEGRQHILTHAPLDTLPLFIKAGTILPEGPVLQYAGQDKGQALPLTIHVYAGLQGESELQFYEDDGLTFKYQRGAYNLLTFTLDEQVREMQVGYRFEHRGMTSLSREWELRVHFVSFEPSQVTFVSPSGAKNSLEKSVDWLYEARTRELVIQVQNQENFGVFIVS